jgi:hypothetical protein
MRHVRTNQIFLTLIAFGCAPLLKEGNPRMTLKIGSAASSDRALGTGTSFSSDYCYALHIQGPNLYRVPPSPRDQACAHGPKGLGMLMGLYDAGSEASIEVTVGQRTIHLVGVKKSDIAGVDLSTCAGNVIGANVMPMSGPDQGDGPRVEMTINGVPVQPANSNSGGSTSNNNGDEGDDHIEMKVFAEANALLVPGNNNVAMQPINGGAGTEYGCDRDDDEDPPSNNMQGPFVFPWPDGDCNSSNGCTLKTGMDRSNLRFTVLCSLGQFGKISFNDGPRTADSGLIACTGSGAEVVFDWSSTIWNPIFDGDPHSGLNVEVLAGSPTPQVIRSMALDFMSRAQYKPLTNQSNGQVPTSGQALYDTLRAGMNDGSSETLRARIIGETTGANPGIYIGYKFNTAPKVTRVAIAPAAAGLFEELAWADAGTTPVSSSAISTIPAHWSNFVMTPSFGLGWLVGASSVLSSWDRFTDIDSIGGAAPATQVANLSSLGEFHLSQEFANAKDFVTHLHANSGLKFLVNYAGNSPSDFGEASFPTLGGSYSAPTVISGNLRVFEDFVANPADPPIYFSSNLYVMSGGDMAFIGKCPNRSSCAGSSMEGLFIHENLSDLKARTAFFRAYGDSYAVTLGSVGASAFGSRLRLNAGYFSSTISSALQNPSGNNFSTSLNFYPAWTQSNVVEVEAINFRMSDYPNVFAGAPDLEGNLVAVGSTRFSGVEYAVIYRSRDGGLNWHRVYKGAPNTRILDAAQVSLRQYDQGSERLRPGFAFLEAQGCPYPSPGSCTGGYTILHQSHHGF